MFEFQTDDQSPMNKKRTAIIIFVSLLVASTGCSSLAGSNEESTGTPAEVRGSTTVTSATNTLPTKVPVTSTTAPMTSIAPKTSAPTDTVTTTVTSTATVTPTETPHFYERNVTIKAVGNGKSYYRVYTEADITLGSKADRPGEAEHSDELANDHDPEYVEGFVGDGGVDSYRIDVSQPDAIVNDGTATLKIYINGNLTRTVEPGAGVATWGQIGPPYPTKTTTTIRGSTATETTTGNTAPTAEAETNSEVDEELLDSNDNQSMAERISERQSIEGQVGQYFLNESRALMEEPKVDTDVYTFNATAGQTIVIDGSVGLAGVSLINTNGTTLDTQAGFETRTGKFNLTTRANKTAMYYLKVAFYDPDLPPKASGVSSYEFTFSTTATPNSGSENSTLQADRRAATPDRRQSTDERSGMPPDRGHVVVRLPARSQLPNDHLRRNADNHRPRRQR
jgi:hypothetical protein